MPAAPACMLRPGAATPPSRSLGNHPPHSQRCGSAVQRGAGRAAHIDCCRRSGAASWRCVPAAGGKKGVDMAGMSDLGGVKFFNLAVDTPEGDLEVLELVLQGAAHNLRGPRPAAATASTGSAAEQLRQSFRPRRQRCCTAVLHRSGCMLTHAPPRVPRSAASAPRCCQA